MADPAGSAPHLTVAGAAPHPTTVAVNVSLAALAGPIDTAVVCAGLFATASSPWSTEGFIPPVAAPPYISGLGPLP
jgi:hypothetical protein